MTHSFFLITLFIFGTLFGSLASVIIHRLKSGEGGILLGRSHCSKCNKVLSWYQLIPIFSWIFSKGRCKDCQQSIGIIYPVLELTTGALFASIGYFLVDIPGVMQGQLGSIMQAVFWIFTGYITILYVFYDILFLEIHETILGVGVLGALVSITVQSLTTVELSILHIISIIITVLSIGALYGIMTQGWSEKTDSIILAGIWIVVVGYMYMTVGEYPMIQALIGALAIFSFFFIQIILSKGTWMGGGDLRIALFIGLILGSSWWLPGLFMTYMVGSVIGITLILFSKIRHGWKQSVSTQVPFGPFLGIGFFLTFFFQEWLEKIISVYF